ncbi:hypothetical protein [Amycolatopsis thermoflava]|uniref:hypothetical protein n=1 Tax=Amycolatopsis thermoflava TaxID=84480 RepID=UPI0012FC7104|nr:hypothetical protein [Amycolatopsis thermoflava]
MAQCGSRHIDHPPAIVFDLGTISSEQGGKMRLLRRAALFAVSVIMVLSTAVTPTAGAAPAIAAEPSAVPFSPDDDVTISEIAFVHTADGLRRAKEYVHSGDSCAFAFCTIQNSSGGRFYKVFKMSPSIYVCTTVRLSNFLGRWDTHNHSTDTAELQDQYFRTNSIFPPGRRDPARWDPIYFITFCQ